VKSILGVGHKVNSGILSRLLYQVIKSIQN